MEEEKEKEDKSIVCYKCGNGTFIIRESMLGAFSIGCAECGEGHIFGPGLSARTIAAVLKGNDKLVKSDLS